MEFDDNITSKDLNGLETELVNVMVRSQWRERKRGKHISKSLIDEKIHASVSMLTKRDKILSTHCFSVRYHFKDDILPFKLHLLQSLL